MGELQQILPAMQADYPCARLSDHVKLIYQNEFGCAHLAKGGMSPEDLRREAAAARRGRSLFESIGNGYRRIYLKNALDLGASPETLCAMAEGTAAESRGSRESFARKLDLLYQLCREKKLPFSAGSCQLYLLNYEAAGYPAVHHSAEYAAAYAPSYRVIADKYARFFELFLRIDSLLRTEQDPILIAIDGPCGSGKTTLAAMLSACYPSNLFHADDFYLRPEQRTPERFREAGGNMDRERLEEEVLRPLSLRRDVFYRRYSHPARAIVSETPVPYRRVNIIEGSYTLHPRLRPYYHLKAALKISPEHQMARLKRRESQKSLELFRDRWIPLEQAYIAGTGLYDAADLIFDV